MDIRELLNTLCRYCRLLACLLLSCFILEKSLPLTQLEKVIESGELRVISRNGPTTYYEGAEGLTGYGYKLVKGFADQLGVNLVIINESQSPLSRLLNGTEDMVAAMITTKEAKQFPVRFAIPHRQIQFELVGNVDNPAPKELAALEGFRVLLTPELAQHPSLKELQKANPQIIWQLAETNDQTNLLSKINRGQLELAIIDSDTFQLHRYAFNRTQVVLNVGEPEDLAWAFSSSPDKSLFNQAQNYLIQMKESGDLARISAEFFQPAEDMTSIDALMLGQHLEQRLTPYMEDMKRAAERYNLDWRLLAAIGYKESQWLTKVTSFTGVKGMMMLTKRTAKAMGVKDREDPRQAIFGAAKLFRYLLDNQPSSIEGDERIHFALASYNQGMGHIADARRLTRRMGRDPNRWQDVKKYLPLLSLSKYYTQARHGYMRGKEPVVFVDRIWDYYKMIVWHDQQENLRLATASSAPHWL